MRAGDHAVEVWQSSQTLLVDRCALPLPVAVVPLWQLEQLDVIPLWLKVAGDHAVVRWQLEHSAVVGTCVAGLPRALVPLWQLAQVPITSL